MMKLLAIFLLIAMATAYPFYPPQEEYELVELVRVPRALPGDQRQRLYKKFYKPQQQQQQQQQQRYNNQQLQQQHRFQSDELFAAPSQKEPITAETGHGGGHGHDYVDYGAYTGGWGAFGWYSDHPVGGGWGH